MNTTSSIAATVIALISLVVSVVGLKAWRKSNLHVGRLALRNEILSAERRSIDALDLHVQTYLGMRASSAEEFVDAEDALIVYPISFKTNSSAVVLTKDFLAERERFLESFVSWKNDAGLHSVVGGQASTRVVENSSKFDGLTAIPHYIRWNALSGKYKDAHTDEMLRDVNESPRRKE